MSNYLIRRQHASDGQPPGTDPHRHVRKRQPTKDLEDEAGKRPPGRRRHQPERPLPLP